MQIMSERPIVNSLSVNCSIDELSSAVRSIYVGETLNKWIKNRVGNYMANILRDASNYYTRWDIRKVIFDLSQRMDSASHVCLYLSVNSNHPTSSGTRRTNSLVGLNRNPITSTQMRNGRYNRTSNKTKQGWKLLVYVVLAKKKFTGESLSREMARIGALKGVESKVLHIMRFGVRHKAAVRFDAQMLQEGSKWYKPAVQRYISSQVQLMEQIV